LDADGIREAGRLDNRNPFDAEGSHLVCAGNVGAAWPDFVEVSGQRVAGCGGRGFERSARGMRGRGGLGNRSRRSLRLG
jgi:hypothetical protein